MVVSIMRTGIIGITPKALDSESNVVTTYQKDLDGNVKSRKSLSEEKRRKKKKYSIKDRIVRQI